MGTRRALISKDDLNRMALTVAQHGVVFQGRVTPSGDLTFRLTPFVTKPEGSADDLDDRLADWAAS
ncbi:hypothetical protein [Erythrobacter rubeus]|uniref:Uncharacterized protein n=1 Tax=Erythrobacter rubeus TaxID=2760803 RepID=A0ABR8KR76_9SPHN|nr:hypothetical protein [Erythrobacter rubeus]MBD2840762.1 hypothetical protein [Erythrobacter rubeus]